MGMQCHFTVSDAVDAGLDVNIGRQDHGDYIESFVKIKDGAGNTHRFACDTGFESCYFDIGYQSEQAMLALSMLIQYRICFNCS